MKFIKDGSSGGTNATFAYQHMVVVVVVFHQLDLSAIELDLRQVARAVLPSNPL